VVVDDHAVFGDDHRVGPGVHFPVAAQALRESIGRFPIDPQREPWEVMKIRTFQEADSAGVAALWAITFPDDPPHNSVAVAIPQKLAIQPELFFVAEQDGRVVGTIMAGYDGHRGWLYTVAVHPDQRRQGLGGRLVRHAEAALAALGCKKINLQVRASNSGVVEFYEKLGYRVEERVSMGKRLPD
jgi:ribosomal protein S18 acetylase RimI-like enzyme